MVCTSGLTIPGVSGSYHPTNSGSLTAERSSSHDAALVRGRVLQELSVVGEAKQPVAVVARPLLDVESAVSPSLVGFRRPRRCTEPVQKLEHVGLVGDALLLVQEASARLFDDLVDLGW
jgi:hypothetical protein